MTRKPLDYHCQIRIRAYRDGETERFAVHLGFWIIRRTRVWVDEAGGHIGTYETREEAIEAATQPALVARRDHIRDMRENPPAPAPYLILPNVCYKVRRDGWYWTGEEPTATDWSKAAARASRFNHRAHAETFAAGHYGAEVVVCQC